MINFREFSGVGCGFFREFSGIFGSFFGNSRLAAGTWFEIVRPGGVKVNGFGVLLEGVPYSFVRNGSGGGTPP